MEEHLKEGFMEILVALITKLTENKTKQVGYTQQEGPCFKRISASLMRKDKGKKACQNMAH